MVNCFATAKHIWVDWHIQKWQNECHWQRTIREHKKSVHWFLITEGYCQWTGKPAAYEIYSRLHVHKVCARWVPNQLTDSMGIKVWASVTTFLTGIMRKTMPFCITLSLVMKCGPTIIRQTANTRVWSGNTPCPLWNSSSDLSQKQKNLCSHFCGILKEQDVMMNSAHWS
jgi:hypothetical protein